ncbi:hypothetical protein SFRURICE_004100, partial [Spodoptera frugiperda]
MSSSKTRSPIWQYFDLNSDDNKYAVCLLCHVKISRGGEGKKAGTSAMSNHLKSKHPEEFKLINKKKTEITKITSSGLSCISEAIPHISALKKYLDKNETAQRTPDLARMRASLKAELESRFKSLGDNPNYLIATFLDPRFKSDYLGVLETEKARQKIMIEYIKNSCEESSSD